MLNVVFLDFTMPFDSGSHSILMDELSSCGMSGFTLLLVKNWMKDRAERVVVNGMTSVWGLDTSNAPQGSILGPGLFNMCVKSRDVGNVPLAYLLMKKTGRCC